MKLKFINCLLAVAMICGAAQFLTSCKDNNEDELKGLELENSRLADRISANEQLIQSLNAQLGNIVSCSCAGKGYVTTADVTKLINEALAANPGGLSEDEVKTLITNALNEVGQSGSVQGIVDEVGQAIESITSGNPEIQNLTDYFAYLERTLASLQTQINELDKCGCDLSAIPGLVDFKDKWESKLPDIEKNAQDAYNKALANKTSIDSLGTILDGLVGLPAEVATLKTDVQNAKDKADAAYKLAEDNLTAAKNYTDQAIDKIKGGYDGTMQDLLEKINAVDKAAQDAIAENTKKINDLNDEVDAIKNDIDVLKDAIKNLENRISSIVIQGVSSPVLGYLSTPLGINSNILLAFYGSSSADVTMPSYAPGIECNVKEWWGGEAGYLFVSSIANTTTIPAGEYIQDNDANLGKVYFTCNPSNIDMDGKTFAIVNSLGQELPIELRNIKPSNYLLTHGYSRAIETSANGFYEADAHVAANTGACGKLAIVVEPGLKDAFVDVAKDMKYVYDNHAIPASGKEDILTLGKKIYQQIDGFVPAVGLRGAWLEDETNYQVTSNYGMAATVIKPLSFHFLADQANPNRHFPEIDLGKLRDKFDLNFNVNHITLPGLDLSIVINPIMIDIDTSDMNFDFDFDLNFDDIDFSIGDINTDIELTDLDEVKMTIVIENFPINAEAGGEVIKGGGEDGQDKVDVWVKLVKGTEKFEDVTANLSEVGDKISSTISSKLAEVVAEINNSLNDNFKEDLANSINSQLGDKINDQINAQLKENLDKVFANVSSQINSQIQDMIDDVISKIQDEFDNYIKNLESNINDQLDSLRDQINNTLKDKVNGLFDRIENSNFYKEFQKMIDRANLLIQDPNHYLQAIMLYKNADGFGKMSTSKAFPSMMKLAGGDAITLIPTTYTAETVSPAYKKFIVVTNVYKNTDYNVNALNDATCENLVKKANGENNMNSTFNGNIRTVALNLQGGAGYTYEILYQALDYSGYTSTQKYYVSVR